MDILFLLSVSEGVLYLVDELRELCGTDSGQHDACEIQPLINLRRQVNAVHTYTSRVYCNPEQSALVRHNDNRFSFCLRQR